MSKDKYETNSTIIERDSIRNLESKLRISNRIFPYINKNDKTPMLGWEFALTTSPVLQKKV